MKKIMLWGAIVLVTIVFVLYVSVSIVIGVEVQRTCETAMHTYAGSCGSALIENLNDNKSAYISRNHAIWALGQLGSPEAHPVLHRYYTGNVSARESLNKDISQHELKKALNLTSGGVNISAWVWKIFYTLP